METRSWVQKIKNSRHVQTVPTSEPISISVTAVMCFIRCCVVWMQVWFGGEAMLGGRSCRQTRLQSHMCQHRALPPRADWWRLLHSRTELHPGNVHQCL